MGSTSFLPGIFDALRRLAQADFAIVLITNQSAIGRDIVSYEQALGINCQVVEVIRAQGGRIDGAYLCPHHPDDNCDCRKPRPGLLLQAAADLDLDLGGSYFVGDAMTDMQAAEAAGVKGILVLTGRGQEQIRKEGLESLCWLVAPDLGAAVDHILNERTPRNKYRATRL
jgi:D-glycero-D-manno-heptose 1,7-bisphosphate phosphatase